MKKLKVDENLCIGCGACKNAAPDDFVINSQGLSEAKNKEVSEDNKAVIEAVEICQTGAITLEDSEECNCEHCECEHCNCNHEE